MDGECAGPHQTLKCSKQKVSCYKSHTLLWYIGPGSHIQLTWRCYIPPPDSSAVSGILYLCSSTFSKIRSKEKMLGIINLIYLTARLPQLAVGLKMTWVQNQTNPWSSNRTVCTIEVVCIFLRDSMGDIDWRRVAMIYIQLYARYVLITRMYYLPSTAKLMYNCFFSLGTLHQREMIKKIL